MTVSVSVISLLNNLKYIVVNNKMPDKIEVEQIDLGIQTIAQIYKLPQQIIDYLWERIDIAKKKQICHKKYLAGKISHSYLLEDPQNLVIQNLHDILFNSVDNPKMFNFMSREIGRICKKKMNTTDKDKQVLQPYLESIWVNFQKKGEFQPIHSHSGMFSFVIWMDIPYHPKDEAKLYFTRSSSSGSTCGNFSFAISNDVSRSVVEHFIELSPEKNGYCCLFPSDLSHQVYPFYTSDKDRISISGNMGYHFVLPNPHPEYQFPFHTSET